MFARERFATKNRTYIAIDLKSFYASVECVERGLDALNTHLVVADASRTEKTICLAVSPSLKTYGIPGRARLFEVVQAVRKINAERRRNAPGRRFRGASFNHAELQADPALELSYIVAPPQMAHYMEVSSRIYGIYLRHIAPEDIHVYSIDEVFIDATDYLKTYRLTPHELTRRLVQEVLDETGITATAGIGSNLYLCKIAMDIEAKHSPADRDGVRIAELDETSYRRKYWTHRPLTDFWRVGHGIAARLEEAGLYTMGDIARCSLGKPWDHYNEDLLYKLFGINAELLIDHAWGWESCTMADIKAYKPAANSLSVGQVLQEPYDFKKAKLVVREMTDQLVLELVDKGLVTDQLVLSIGYEQHAPKPAHGSANLPRPSSSTRLITEAMMELFDRIVDPTLQVRRMYVVAAHVIEEKEVAGIQLGLFDEPAEEESRERSRQEAILAIRRKFGK
ncbi:MAG: DNA methylase, partial [Bacteroidales bacterium]|nr:DNA methylase [Bacteroidales bacterium]